MTNPEQTFRTTVQPQWIDYNGHMNVGYYVVAFDLATDVAYDRWGIGEDYLSHSDCSVFTLGMNVDYISEVFEGDPIRVSTTLIDHDHKRLHYYHQMYHDGTSDPVATNECLCMHVNLKTRKSHPFPEFSRLGTGQTQSSNNT